MSRANRFLRRLGFALVAPLSVALATGCGGPDTPEPVAVESACAAGDGALVEAVGFLRLPDSISLTDRATIDLFTRRGGGGDRVAVELILGSAPNQLERPVEGFTATSLRVTAADGTVLTINDPVRVVARVRRDQAESCLLTDLVITPEPRRR